MKTKTHLHQSRPWKTLASLAAIGLLGISNAKAEYRAYDVSWYGSLEGNSAVAVAKIVLDLNQVANPGDDFRAIGFGQALVSIHMTVSGASSGNGIFNTSDFANYRIKILDPLDLNLGWYGQAQPSGNVGAFWGTPDGNNHDFNFGGPNTNAPTGVGPTAYVLQTAGGAGDRMRLGAFVIAAPGDVTNGQEVINVPGAIVSAINSPAMASDGSIYWRGKIKGTNVTALTDTCLLGWNGSVATVVVREGDDMGGNELSVIGDPIIKGQRLYFSGKIRMGGSVTNTNDEILGTALTTGGGATQLAREGVPATGVEGFAFQKFLWMHPTSSGLFFGAQVVNISDPTQKKMGVWYSLPFNSPMFIQAVGNSVVVNGTSKVIKSITKPAAGAPANVETRVGNENAITLVIKTVDGTTLLKTFPEPAF
jgi:hypothetical protein